MEKFIKSWVIKNSKKNEELLLAYDLLKINPYIKLVIYENEQLIVRKNSRGDFSTASFRVNQPSNQHELIYTDIVFDEMSLWYLDEYIFLDKFTVDDVKNNTLRCYGLANKSFTIEEFIKLITPISVDELTKLIKKKMSDISVIDGIKFNDTDNDTLVINVAFDKNGIDETTFGKYNRLFTLLDTHRLNFSYNGLSLTLSLPKNKINVFYTKLKNQNYKYR